MPASFLYAAFAVLLASTMAAAGDSGATTRPAAGVLLHIVKDIEGNDVDLKQYSGRVLMIVNVASQCGHTPQYAKLEAIYRKYKDQGLVVLGFPANDFGQQEPGTNEQIAQFCSTKYNVTFPMFSKISVKGNAKAPLYQYLTRESPFAGEIGWNFTKFLVDRSGNVVARFDSGTQPDAPEVIAAIEKHLQVDQ